MAAESASSSSGFSMMSTSDVDFKFSDLFALKIKNGDITQRFNPIVNPTNDQRKPYQAIHWAAGLKFQETCCKTSGLLCPTGEARGLMSTKCEKFTYQFPKVWGDRGLPLPGQPKEKCEDHIKSTAKIVASTAILAPIERVKKLMQSQHLILRSGRLASPYLGVSDCLFRTIKSEGVCSLWRGNLANTVSQVGFQILQLNASLSESMPRHWLYGIAATQQVAFYPFHVAHTLLANDIDMERKFEGIVDCWSKIARSEGILGLYRGALIGTLSSVSSNIIQPAFLALSNKLPSSENEWIDKEYRNFFAILLSKFALLPMDTVNQRIIMANAESYRGIFHTVCEMKKKEGFRSFYKGSGAQTLLVAGTTCGVDIAVELAWRMYFSRK